ncbi:MAG: hypothetical protein CM1200mP16_15740 [Nitrospina sp.]|nr:MAG: hypothetical protein CM1200mP16_15740 [Nitrospina sp.]
MAELENNGFLSKPHTSAGRFPTDKGYRFYVDHLLRPQNFLMEAEILSETRPFKYTPGKKTYKVYWKRLAKFVYRIPANRTGYAPWFQRPASNI